MKYWSSNYGYEPRRRPLRSWTTCMWCCLGSPPPDSWAAPASPRWPSCSSAASWCRRCLQQQYNAVSMCNESALRSKRNVDKNKWRIWGWGGIQETVLGPFFPHSHRVIRFKWPNNRLPPSSKKSWILHWKYLEGEWIRYCVALICVLKKALI